MGTTLGELGTSGNLGSHKKIFLTMESQNKPQEANPNIAPFRVSLSPQGSGKRKMKNCGGWHEALGSGDLGRSGGSALPGCVPGRLWCCAHTRTALAPSRTALGEWRRTSPCVFWQGEAALSRGVRAVCCRKGGRLGLELPALEALGQVRGAQRCDSSRL